MRSSSRAALTLDHGLFALGTVFLLLGVVVFALLALEPFGVVSPSSWEPFIFAIGGGMGLVLIGLGMYERRGKTGRGRRG